MDAKRDRERPLASAVTVALTQGDFGSEWRCRLFGNVRARGRPLRMPRRHGDGEIGAEGGLDRVRSPIARSYAPYDAIIIF
jgi:hypothetical protein